MSDELNMKRESARELLQTPIYRVIEEMHSHPKLPKAVPYYVVDCLDWVNIIAIDKDSPRHSDAKMLWVKQYRVGPEKVTMEIPGGSLEEDDTNLQRAAERELFEETGATAASWHYLGALSPNAAFFRNRVHTFLATGCRKHADPLGDGLEVIAAEWVPWEKRHELVLSGAVDHGLVVCALALLDAHLNGSGKAGF